jgi:hypothetical protein
MTFLDDMKNLFNTPAIPGIPNSRFGDLFGIGPYLGTPSNPVDTIERGVDKASAIADNLPYIIIGGGTLFLIFLLKK